MPELPEVELISRSLDSLVRGRTVVSAELRRERLAPEHSPAEFSGKLKGSYIELVHRRGKHILFRLGTGNTLIVHLRMSGRFSILSGEMIDPKFSHAVFYLDGGDRLVFDDQRHFGLMKIVPTSALNEARELAKLAPEPFSDEFSVDYFGAALKTSKRSLKEFLIDQTKVCGLGNIYACEAMFDARVHPAKPADKLTRPRIARLHASIRQTLGQAVSHASARVVDPTNLEGGYFSGSSDAGWAVYGRENEPCLTCEAPIVRLKQGGRSTYFCRHCQRK